MGSLTLHTRVTARDHLGRFLSKIHEDAVRTVEETAKRTADVARSGATVKTGAMRSSIRAISLGATTWGVTVGTDHWKYQEDGTGPHPISGNVRFFWESRGRMWTPGSNTISHPGNPAVHFMAHAHSFANSYFMAAAQRNFL